MFGDVACKAQAAVCVDLCYIVGLVGLSVVPQCRSDIFNMACRWSLAPPPPYHSGTLPLQRGVFVNGFAPWLLLHSERIVSLSALEAALVSGILMMISSLSLQLALCRHSTHVRLQRPCSSPP